MGPLGTPEMIFIFLLALLLFGPKKLPEIGRTVGKAITEFRRASNELKATFDREMKNLEAETGVKEIVNQYQYENYNYDHSYESTYEPTYESSYDSTTHETAPSTLTTTSASATQDAESPVAVVPEGTVARHPEITSGERVVESANNGSSGPHGTPDGNSPSTAAAEHKA
jgi:sec-independent protein translocase protein TatA